MTISQYFKIKVKEAILFLYRCTLHSKIKKIRNKEKIKVLFIITDISKWKSEPLYIEMLKNDRFNPLLRLSQRGGISQEIQQENSVRIKEYLESKKYNYLDGSNELAYDADIVIYTEPYLTSVSKIDNIYHRLNSLFININYCSHLTTKPISCFETLYFFSWMDCYENRLAAEEAESYINETDNRGIYMSSSRNNIVVTGLPISDILMTPPVSNPWKTQKNKKKKIIWAPHHSITDDESTPFANFLEIADNMWELSQKYIESTQWSFKPHPFLKPKLQKLWGAKKTEDYYNLWANGYNTQINEGNYVDLFKHSDAMVHDSFSFITEYLYMNKPVMFIKNGKSYESGLNTYARMALSMHEVGINIYDIEQFIRRIINDTIEYDDTERRQFYNNILVPPNGRSASCNIIEAILNMH